MPDLSLGNQTKNYQEIKTPFPEILLGFIGRGHNTLDYSQRDGSEAANRHLRQQELDFLMRIFPNKKNIILNQTHGNDIFCIDRKTDNAANNKPKRVFGDGDGVICNHMQYLLTIVTADCFPLFFYSPSQQILGAVHAGWQGTHKQISSKAIDLMRINFSTSIDNLHVFILPGISQPHYEIQQDVAALFPEFILSKNGQIFLDVQQANITQLHQAGIRSENIHILPLCTFRDQELLFSHRRKDKERVLNFICFR